VFANVIFEDFEVSVYLFIFITFFFQGQLGPKHGSQDDPDSVNTPYIIGNSDYGEPTSSRLPGAPTSALYAMETLAVTVTGAGVTALLLGFILGFILGRKISPGGACVKDASRFDSAGPCVDAEYEFLEQRPSASTMGHHGTLGRLVLL
jgi:hypothetical protein